MCGPNDDNILPQDDDYDEDALLGPEEQEQEAAATDVQEEEEEYDEGQNDPVNEDDMIELEVTEE